MSRKIEENYPDFLVRPKNSNLGASQSVDSGQTLRLNKVITDVIDAADAFRGQSASDVNSAAAAISAQKNRDKLSKLDLRAQEDALTRGVFEPLYKRGINLLRPEIIATTEFIPLSKSGQLSTEETPLSLRYGENKELQINQIVRLIELHRLINLAVNKSASDFINKVAIPDLPNVTDESLAFRSSP